jgi:hypothetical protein
MYQRNYNSYIFCKNVKSHKIVSHYLIPAIGFLENFRRTGEANSGENLATLRIRLGEISRLFDIAKLRPWKTVERLPIF